MDEQPLLPTGSVDRSVPNARWWQYRRNGEDHIEAPRPVGKPATAAAPVPTVRDAAPSTVAPSTVAPSTVVVEGSDAPPPVLAASAGGRSGFVPAVFAVLVAGMAIGIANWTDETRAGRFLLPVVGLLTAAAFVPMLERRHPDEPWLGRFLMWGVAFKIVATLARYYTFEGGGDAVGYHRYGVEFVHGVAEPLGELRKTAYVDFVVGHVYSFIGADQIAGFLAFGLFAFIGSYAWYRATASAVPFVNRRMYCAIVFFLPSIAFWPASLGKEALMQFAIGMAALGTALILGGKVWRGLLTALPGGYLMWAVRPHVLALVTVSAAVAYIVGRRAPKPGSEGQLSVSAVRPLMTVIVAVLSVFAVAQAMQFLGMESLSLKSISTELNEQAGNTAQGDSAFDSGQSKSLTPLSLPEGAVTVLLRPFPWEISNGNQLVASVEAALITCLVIKRRHSLAASLTHARSAPFLIYCWALTAMYSVAFSAFSNMGLLVRQRSLVLPAFFVLLCVEPALAERHREQKRAAAGLIPTAPNGPGSTAPTSAS